MADESGNRRGTSTLFSSALRVTVDSSCDLEQTKEFNSWRPLQHGCQVCKQKVIPEKSDTARPCFFLTPGCYDLKTIKASVDEHGNMSSPSDVVEHFTCHPLSRLEKLSLPDNSTFNKELQERTRLSINQEPIPTTAILEQDNAGFKDAALKNLVHGIQSLHRLARISSDDVPFTLSDQTSNTRIDDLANTLFQFATALQHPGTSGDQSRDIYLRTASRDAMEEYVNDLISVSLFKHILVYVV